MKKSWFKESVVYQIYPRSFMDSNGDGIGDIRGIISKLDYLKNLGVDIVWLSPIYKSPNDDNGYDISDYRDIMEEFGTMQDFDDLLQEIHIRGMKLIMDLVVNHSSDEHIWFQESRLSKDNPYRDYYTWKAGKDGKEPNNWESLFSNSAWEYDDLTDEYYLHLFSKKQPDLNWENPNLRREIYEMMKWWLDKGIDGFRMDVINFISKVPELPDAGDIDQPCQSGWEYFVNGPKIHTYLQEMNREVLSKYDIMTVGETPGVTPELAIKYAGNDSKQLDMVFQFNHMTLRSVNENKWYTKDWKLTDLKKIITKWQTSLHEQGWNTLFMNNHDSPRMVSHFGNDTEYRVESAKMLATMLLTLQGTPYIYQGEEIGMTNVVFDCLDDYRDVETFNAYKEHVVENGRDYDEFMEVVHTIGRDNARTPMQWDDSCNAGFTNGQPWIKVNPNYKEINTNKELADTDSILNYYKNLIILRKNNRALIYGKYIPIHEDHEKIFAYERITEDDKLLIILNFNDNTTEFIVPDHLMASKVELLTSNYNVIVDQNISNLSQKSLIIKPYEARVYRIC